jgi:hypothetical protein
MATTFRMPLATRKRKKKNAATINRRIIKRVIADFI